jgi:hypothetical protein
MKVLIDKTENDDKLINMLKAEIKKLEGSKGVTSSLTQGMSKAAMTKHMTANANSNQGEELYKMQTRINMLNNNVKCMEIEIEHKDDKIEALMKNCIGAPDERLEENEILLSELQD